MDYMIFGMFFIFIILIMLIIENIKIINRIIELEKNVELNRINKVTIADVYRDIDLKLSIHDFNKSCKEYKELVDRMNLNK